MPVGICKEIGGWGGDQDSAKVRYEGGDLIDVPRDVYESSGFQPPFDSLPECETDDEPSPPPASPRT